MPSETDIGHLRLDQDQAEVRLNDRACVIKNFASLSLADLTVEGIDLLLALLNGLASLAFEDDGDVISNLRLHWLTMVG
ncbi:hypothetical protein GCM10027040_26360 [Halomonas shantousis]